MKKEKMEIRAIVKIMYLLLSRWQLDGYISCWHLIPELLFRHQCILQLRGLAVPRISEEGGGIDVNENGAAY
jgi:hypothetical protein